MTEIGNELMQLKGSPEEEQSQFREKFHLLEDEQISIDNLFRKATILVKSRRKIILIFPSIKI